MLSRNNKTMAAILNETSPGQQNSPCVFIDSTAENISKLCVYCFIFLGSFFGNTFTIIIVYKNRDLRKTINYFIVNMAVSDLLFSLIAMPYLIIGLVSDSWHWRVSGILGSIFCKLYIFVIEVSLLVSAQSLVWIAIDRFVAVVFPMRLGIISKKTRTVAIVSTWIIGGIFYFPSLITMGLDEYGNSRDCIPVNSKSIFPNQEAAAGYNWLQLTFRFIAPIFLITIFYTAITIVLKRQSKALADTASIVQRHSLQKRRQAIQMAVLIVVLFHICVLPYALKRLIHQNASCAFQQVFLVLANFLWFSSASVNPIICLSFVQSYRRRLKNILFSCMRMQNINKQNRNAKREQITLKGVKTFPD
ncbi:QRFP-like peptide receptor [Oculina patagonica]